MKYILIFVIFLIGTGSGLCGESENKKNEWSPSVNYNNNIQQYETPFRYHNQRNNYNNIQPYSNANENVQYEPYFQTIKSTVPAVPDHQYNIGLPRHSEFGTHPNHYIQSPNDLPYFYMLPPYPTPRTPTSFSNHKYSSYPTHLPLQQGIHKTSQTSYPAHNLPMRQGNYNNYFRHSPLQIQYENGKEIQYMPSTFNGYQRRNDYPGNSESLAAPDLPVLGPDNFYVSGYKSARDLNGYSVPHIAPRELGNGQQYYMQLPGSSAKPFDLSYQYVYPTK